MVFVTGYSEFERAYCHSSTEHIVLKGDVELPPSSPLCDAEGEGTCDVLIDCGGEEGVRHKISSSQPIYLKGTNLRFENIDFNMTGEFAFDVTMATASFKNCTITATGEIFRSNNCFDRANRTLTVTDCDLEGSTIAHLGVASDVTTPAFGSAKYSFMGGTAATTDVAYILENDFGGCELSSGVELNCGADNVLQVCGASAATTYISITNIVNDNADRVLVKQDIAPRIAFEHTINIGFAEGATLPKIFAESNTTPQRSYRCIYNGVTLSEAQVDYKIDAAKVGIPLQHIFNELHGCQRAEVWIPETPVPVNAAPFTIKNARNIILKGEGGLPAAILSGDLLLTQYSTVIVDGTLTIDGQLILDPQAKVLGTGSVTASGNTITALPLMGPFSSITSAVPTPMVGSSGSSSSDGYNNKVLQAMIDKYGDRIKQIVFDNHIIAYIGYPSTNSVPHVSDLMLETLNGMDLVGIRSTTNDRHGRPQSWVTWHPTGLIQSVLIMDEHSKNYQPNPMAIS